jgi:hypothetical protein
MQQPTIEFEGVEIPDFGDRPYPYGVVELTKHCNLRCTTCFFFQAFQHDAKDLRDAELIEKLRALQKRQRIVRIAPTSPQTRSIPRARSTVVRGGGPVAAALMSFML